MFLGSAARKPCHGCNINGYSDGFVCWLSVGRGRCRCGKEECGEFHCDPQMEMNCGSQLTTSSFDEVSQWRSVINQLARQRRMDRGAVYS